MRKSPLPSEWKCRYCGEIKPIAEMVINSKGYTCGLCKSCKNAKAREYRLREGITKHPRSWVFPSPTEKRCPNCNEVKPLSEFYTRSGRRTLNSHCKQCNKDNWKNYDSRRGVCKILKEHREILKEDPERLSTDFIRNLINPGLECKEEPESKEVAAE